MNIGSKCKFTKTIIFPFTKITYDQTGYLLKSLIPLQWQLLLINDGSFTQDLNSLTGRKIIVEIISSSSYKSLNIDCSVREIWLIDYNYNKLAFAQSIWTNIDNNTDYIKLSDNTPMGQSLISLQIDIRKELHEIYYGYSQYLEEKFNCNGPTWGRKYTIYHKEKPLTTIQEIFSPKIINFLKK